MFQQEPHGGTDAASIRERKAHLRGLVAERLRLVSDDERARRSERACRHLVAWVERTLPAGAPLAVYAPTRRELSPEPAFEPLARRHPLLFPRVDGDRLVFHAAPVEALTTHSLWVREPPADAPEGVPAALVVPGRAFDLTGGRLGRGKGFYDRALHALGPHVITVGFCFEAQVVPDIPCEPHDVRLDWLVTDEREARRVRAASTTPNEKQNPPRALPASDGRGERDTHT